MTRDGGLRGKLSFLSVSGFEVQNVTAGLVYVSVGGVRSGLVVLAWSIGRIEAYTFKIIDMMEGCDCVDYIRR